MFDLYMCNNPKNFTYHTTPYETYLEVRHIGIWISFEIQPIREGPEGGAGLSDETGLAIPDGAPWGLPLADPKGAGVPQEHPPCPVLLCGPVRDVPAEHPRTAGLDPPFCGESTTRRRWGQEMRKHSALHCSGALRGLHPGQSRASCGCWPQWSFRQIHSALRISFEINHDVKLPLLPKAKVPRWVALATRRGGWRLKDTRPSRVWISFEGPSAASLRLAAGGRVFLRNTRPLGVFLRNTPGGPIQEKPRRGPHRKRGRATGTQRCRKKRRGIGA
jgi:hypothetical protein